LDKVTERYFSILKDYFGEAFKLAQKKKLESRELVRILDETYDDILIRSTLDSLNEDLSNLNWSSRETAIKRLGGLRASYIGSRFTYFPQSPVLSNFLRKTALYADTVILNDDILLKLKASQSVESIPKLHLVEIGIEAIEWLSMESLFASDSDPPICALAPSLSWDPDSNLSFSKHDAILDTVIADFGSDLFGKEFISSENLIRFLSEENDFNKLYSIMKKPELFVFSTGDPFPVEHVQFLQKALQFKYGLKVSPGVAYYYAIATLVTSISAELMSNGSFRPSFVTDLNGVWNNLTWLMRNDNNKIFESLKSKLFSREQLVITSLQQEDLKWLGNVPMDKIGVLRERGELGGLRELIGENVQSLENANDEDFLETGRQVRYNIEQAIKKHTIEVKDLNERYRRLYKIGAASIVVSGTIGIASAVYPPLALASGIIGGGSVLQTVAEYLDLRRQRKELKTKPVAMLFDAKTAV
jgi:hypothetical protein